MMWELPASGLEPGFGAAAAAPPPPESVTLRRRSSIDGRGLSWPSDGSYEELVVRGVGEGDAARAVLATSGAGLAAAERWLADADIAAERSRPGMASAPDAQQPAAEASASPREAAEASPASGRAVASDHAADEACGRPGGLDSPPRARPEPETPAAQGPGDPGAGDRAREPSPGPPAGDRGSWAVVVCGGEGDAFDLYGLGPVHRDLERRLGEDRVILVANVAEIWRARRRAAETGVPELSPSAGLAKSRAFRARKLAELEEQWGHVLSRGGATHDGRDANTSTLLRVLEGAPPGGGPTGRLPSDGSMTSLTVIYAGHGGSFRSVRRGSPLLSSLPCDLCGSPHGDRPARDPSRAARMWAEWLDEDVNSARAAATTSQSTETDEILVEGDAVLTPRGRGLVVARRAVPHRYALTSVSQAGARPCLHPFVYDIGLRERPRGDAWPDSYLLLADTLSRAAGCPSRCPLAAVALVAGFLDAPSLARVTQAALPGTSGSARAGAQATSARWGVPFAGLLLRGCRRDAICAPSGRGHLDHYHSTRRTREWAFGMPHPGEIRDYDFVGWRDSSGLIDPTGLLFGAQLLQGMMRVRGHSPRCRALVMTEACYSGGAAKFMDDEALASHVKLADWPLILVSTAGEAQTSVAGLIRRVTDLAVGERDPSTTMLQVVQRAQEGLRDEHAEVTAANLALASGAERSVRGMAETAVRVTGHAGVATALVTDFFGAAADPPPLEVQ